ncbi:hypothetical protein Sden_3463 [Shewanella denitrificans OS217]|uniref:Uncharacterized protein n=1 Tax=Shewanella denitrificans (strain OS217 / ATCC BAA-1090 / DSM 15013) TaxID=318161 RepID=Q12II8_SHEDO|nr:hypothetical protein Sden_3463 [Shewanella denitrificans OS217]
MWGLGIEHGNKLGLAQLLKAARRIGSPHQCPGVRKTCPDAFNFAMQSAVFFKVVNREASHQNSNKSKAVEQISALTHWQRLYSDIIFNMIFYSFSRIVTGSNFCDSSLNP